MRKAVSVLLTLIMLSVAALMIIDSHTIVDTGTGNGAAIVWDNEFENFVAELSPNCSSDMEKITVYREWIIENISYDYECDTLFYQTFDVNTVMQKRKGVCFDYACLFAAMCRSQDIPCYSYASTGQGFLGTNTFAYCNNSPIQFSDATGRIIELSTDVNDGDAAQYNLAVGYLKNSELGSELIEKLESSTKVFTIVFISDDNMRYEPGTRTMYFDPYRFSDPYKFLRNNHGVVAVSIFIYQGG